MQKSRRSWVLLVPAVMTAAVVSLSLGNALQLKPEIFRFPGADKAHHLLAYGCLGVTWTTALRYAGDELGGGDWTRGGWPLWLALFALGTLMEVLQWTSYPGRYFELADMLANAIGSTLGVFGYAWLLRTFPPKT